MEFNPLSDHQKQWIQDVTSLPFLSIEFNICLKNTFLTATMQDIAKNI